MERHSNKDALIVGTRRSPAQKRRTSFFFYRLRRSIRGESEFIMSEDKKNQRYIIRGDSSGVFLAEIVKREGNEVEMKNCRRLWYWDGAASISELAQSGVKRPQNCKFTVTVDSATILDAIEFIPATEKACANIDAVPVWTA